MILFPLYVAFVAATLDKQAVWVNGVGTNSMLLNSFVMAFSASDPRSVDDLTAGTKVSGPLRGKRAILSGQAEGSLFYFVIL